jgi:hypothetical protein
MTSDASVVARAEISIRVSASARRRRRVTPGLDTASTWDITGTERNSEVASRQPVRFERTVKLLTAGAPTAPERAGRVG